MESFILGGTPGDRHQAFSRDRRPVSRIGFGCYALGGAYGSGDPWSWVDLIREAYRLGVTFFDTADQYGSAEEVLGRAVEPFRDQVTIATKVGVTDGGGRDTSPEHVRRSCEASLRRLGTDHIELYQIHFDDPSTPVADTVGALEDLKERGLIGHYGVGHLPLPRVREYARVGSPALAAVHLPELPAHGCAVLGLVEHRRNVPTVIGSDRHVVQGPPFVSQVRTEGGGRLTVTGAPGGPDKVRLWVAVPVPFRPAGTEPALSPVQTLPQVWGQVMVYEVPAGPDGAELTLRFDRSQVTYV